MTIRQIEIFRFSIRMEPFVIATGTMHYAQNVLIKVHTSEGVYGLGECSAFPMIVGETQDTCLAMAREFAQIWKGKDPCDIAARLSELDWIAAHNSTIKSAFDMALYDIAAKLAGQPLYQLLGGEPRTIETDMTLGINTAGAMAEQAVYWQEKGATILKIKLGKKPDEDIRRVQSIRRAVRKEVRLRLDANQGWNFEDALHVLTTLSNQDIEFCEQPMRTWYDDYLPELCRQSPIPVMADESCYNHHDARKLIKARACNFINIKLAKSGGIHEALKIHDTAKAAGMSCMIGSMLESRLALTANLHLAYACSGIHFFDLDTCLLGQLEDPVSDGLTYSGFHLRAPDLPGIGADVDPAFLKRCEQLSV